MIFTTTRVRFPSGSDVLVGDLHQPQGQDTESATTIVIVTGSWTTVKEQQADFYARRLAAAGLNTLVFDFRGFGQSEGNPRCWENPARKVEDIRAAVSFAASQGYTRIGALGIYASAGYQAVNAADDHRVCSLALVAPWLHNRELVAPYYGGEAGVADRIDMSRAGR